MAFLERVFGAPMQVAPPPQQDAKFAITSIATDPEIAAYLAGGWIAIDTGLPTVTEEQAIAIPAYSRAEEIVVGTIKGLILKAYTGEKAARREVPSILDVPQGPASWMDREQWIATFALHLFRYREAYVRPIKDGNGLTAFLELVDPRSVMDAKQSGWGRVFKVKMGDGSTQDFTSDEVFQVLMPPHVGALRAQPIYVTSAIVFQLAIAALKSSGHVFTGAMISGLVTPNDDEIIDKEEVPGIMQALQSRMNGADKAGQLAFVNRHLKITPWRQTNADAQRHETYGDIVEEFARLTGVPPHLLAQVEKQTSWGTGVAEQNVGLSRYTLKTYTDAMQSVLTRVLPDGQFAEIDYAGFLSATPAEEIRLLLEQTGKPILDVDEARAFRNMGPMPEQEEDTDGAQQVGQGEASGDPAEG